MRRQDFHYDLPEELIAQAPLAERSASRMLVLEPPGPGGRLLQDQTVRALPSLLTAGDLIVLNDTRVVAARLYGTKPSGGRVEIFLERSLPTSEVTDDGGGRRALVQLRASKPIRPGLEIATAGGTLTVLDRQDDLWCVECPQPAMEFFECWGQVPLPPYIHRLADDSDRERYQSIFARERGAVAAPTASLHFDAALASAIEARGLARAFVTLHVGAGTFQPVRSDNLNDHAMHAERATVPPATCDAINRTHAAGRRVVAIGTTVVRALEAAAQASESSHLQPWSGETRLFIRPGFDFRVVDALLTNFHLPESTLLMLVCAFAGTERVLAAYRHAVQERYRFFSYGDAMFMRRWGET